MNGPLAGIKVVELAMWVAGPSTSAVLADWGATVVKIEDPAGGDPMRGMTFRTADESSRRVPAPFIQDNRGKRSIALNLRSESGHALAMRLIGQADVFVTNLRLDALERLSLDYPSLSQSHPRLVYASMNAYGHRGPERLRGGFDYAAAWARSGMMATMTEPGQPPPSQRPGMFDHAAGLGLAGAISAALLMRERTGRGQQVSLSLFTTGLWMNSIDLAVGSMTGRPPIAEARADRPNPLWNTYRCADDKWIYFVMPQSDRHWDDFCAALERPDWRQDSRFVNSAERARNGKVLTQQVEAVVASRPLEQWAPVFDRYEFFWAPVQSDEEVLRDPQVEGLGIIRAIDQPEVPGCRVVASPVEFGEGSPGPTAAAPEHGQHTEEILQELGVDWEEIGRLREQGAIG